MTKTLIGSAVLAAMALTAFPAWAEGPQVGVTVGDTDHDACSAFGVVDGLNPNGDNFLSVRSGPATRYAELDRLGPNQGVYICEWRGKWLGVVYDKSGEKDCGVTRHIREKKIYTGPCERGWVFGKYVRQVSG
jgi:hypothetical protein